jgi:hypothetical protein
LGILFRRSKPATRGHHQKNQPGNLQPQLMQHPPKRPPHSRQGASRGPHRPAALSLLRSYPCRHSQLSCRGNLAHGLDFNSLRRYNDRSLYSRSKPLGTRRHPNTSRDVWSDVWSQATGDRGDQLDQQLKQLMKELGEAINESLSDSEQIAEVVSRIKEGGYDIFLVLEATIGVSKQGEKSSDKTSLVTTLSTNPEFKISDQDMKFLKSLRIRIEEEK